MVENNDGENYGVFKILDSMVEQINKTKKVFIILLLTIIIPPAVLILAFGIFGFDVSSMHQGPDHNKLIHIIFFLSIIGIWVIFGGKQIANLHKLTKKYQAFKDNQKKLDEKLNESEDE